MMLFANRNQSDANCVPDILWTSYIFEVVIAILRLVAVAMINFMSLRPWSDKGRRDQTMNIMKLSDSILTKAGYSISSFADISFVAPGNPAAA